MQHSTGLRRGLLAAVAIAIAMMSGLGNAGAAGDPSGMWLTESDAKVRISRCGGGYCGTLVSVSGENRDAQNPDPALRARSLVGVQIMNAPRASGEGWSGTLYNPKDGKTYSGSLKLTGADTAEVAGCVMSVFCKRQTWTRTR